MARVDPNRPTEPIFNILMNFSPSEIQEAFINEMCAVHPVARAAGLKVVQFHRHKLGKASRITHGNRRYHVWDRPLWTAYVNNEYGVKLEIPGVSRSWGEMERNPKRFWPKAVTAWRDYMGAVGLKSAMLAYGGA